MASSPVNPVPPEFSPNDVFSATGAETDELSFRKLIQVVRGRIVTISICTILGVVLSTILASLMTSYYRASTTIEIESKQSSALSSALSAASSEFSGAEDLRVEVQTDITIFQNDALCLKTIKVVDYANHLAQRKHRFVPEFNLDQLSEPSQARESLLEQFKRRIVVTPVQTTRLIVVSFDDPDPKFAAKVANALVEQFIEDRLARRNTTTDEASRSMANQIDDLRKQVERAQQDLSDYERSSGLISTPYSVGAPGTHGGSSAADPLLERLTHVNQDLAAAESTRILRQAIYEISKTGSSQDISTLATQAGATGISSEVMVVQTLEQQRDTLKQQIAAVISTYGDRNPHLAELNQRLSEVEKEIRDHRSALQANAEADYQVALKTEKGLQQQYDDLTRQANSKNDAQVQLAVKQQEADSKRAIYQDLFTKLQESNLAEKTQASNISVVGTALPPATAAYPKLTFFVAVGTLAGLIFGLALAFLLNSLDDSVTSGQQVEEITGLPLLGSVPVFQSDPNVQGSSLATPDAEAQEAYRALRTVLLLSQAGSQPKRLLLTSCLPAEGKTTTAYHLANVFTMGGKRVLAIDSDFRRPTLHKRFGLPNARGLSNALTSNVRAEDLILPSPVNENLYLLSAGPLPPNPAELLESKQLGDLLSRLELQYDMIILDTPPLMLFTDAIILSRLAEGVVLVTRWKKTSMQTLRRAAELLHRNHVRPRGFVLNFVDTSSVDHYYNYGYYGTNYTGAYRDQDN